MSVLCDFFREMDGRVDTGGPLMYALVLGLFLSVVAAMGPDNGARRLAGHSGTTVQLDIGGLFERSSGLSLPQVGPLVAR